MSRAACSATAMRSRAHCSPPATTRTIAAGRCRCGTIIRKGSASNFADVANIAGRAGGSITAACFLSRFTQQIRLGAPRHRGHGVEGRQGKGRHRPPGADARHLAAVARGDRLKTPDGMTTIDFYTHVGEPLKLVAKLVAKAWRMHGNVRVLTPDAKTTARARSLAVDRPAAVISAALPDGKPDRRRDADLDRRDARSCRTGGRSRQPASGAAAVLQPLRAPRRNRRRQRARSLAGRARFRFYRERGYDMRQHDWSRRNEICATSTVTDADRARTP